MAEVKTVQAGELSKRIRILRQAAEQTPDGFYTDQREVTVRECWAKVSFVSGTEMSKANADFGQVKARFLIRHPGDTAIGRKMFVRYGGRDYDIEFVNDYAGRKYLEIWGTWNSNEE